MISPEGKRPEHPIQDLVTARPVSPCLGDSERDQLAEIDLLSQVVLAGCHFDTKGRVAAEMSRVNHANLLLL